MRSFAWIANALSGKRKYRIKTVKFGRHLFRVEIADSLGKMSRGLMGREGLGKDQGMLFVFGRDGKHPFWMLNMKFSIDIIWLDKDGKIVHIANSAKPCKSMFSCRQIEPRENSRYVLEFAAGTAKRINAKRGGRFGL